VFELIKNPHIDWMSKLKIWIAISAIGVIASLILLPVRGINKGIEFTGGAEIQVKYADTPDPGVVRAALDAAGIRNYLVTTISDTERPGEKDLYIRVGVQAEGREEDLSRRVVDALRGGPAAASGKLDLNAADEPSLRALLETSPDLTREAAASLAAEIAKHRREAAVLRSADDLSGTPGLTPQTLDFLKGRTTVGAFSVRSQSYVGPAIGKELIQKAFWAVIVSLGAMLVYIGFRFRFLQGLAAVLSLVHDTIVTLGLFSLFGLELSLPVVAAFLTLIGYSVNDTVVVFDRLREIQQDKRSSDMKTLFNMAINQTMSRTIITSGLTWLVCVALFLFGGEALRPFSFVLVVGIIVGTYSSIFVAFPVLVFAEQWRSKRKQAAVASAPAATPVRKAKKVRTTPAAK